MSIDLRKEAKGRPCMVRFPSICNGDSATVVLAHIRLAGITGAGMKAPDQLGAWCCSACHDAADGRSTYRLWTHEDRKLLFYEGVFRTQAILIKEGKIR